MLQNGVIHESSIHWIGTCQKNRFADVAFLLTCLLRQLLVSKGHMIGRLPSSKRTSCSPHSPSYAISTRLHSQRFKQTQEALELVQFYCSVSIGNDMSLHMQYVVMQACIKSRSHEKACLALVFVAQRFRFYLRIIFLCASATHRTRF